MNRFIRYRYISKRKPSMIFSEASVIVVGAGISGLAAARKLMDNGVSVSLLEAYNKVGGRIRTDRSRGVAFNEGATWIHGTHQNPIMKLATKSGMKTVLSDDDSTTVYDVGGRKYTDREYEEAETKFFGIYDNMMRLGNSDHSFGQLFFELYPYYKNDRLFRFFLSTYVTSDTGDLDTLSSTLYSQRHDEFGVNEVIPANGYDKIAHYLATNLNIKFNERVSGVDYSDKMVKVSHSSGVSEAEFLVVTVPLGVLKAEKIQFTPPLPDRKRIAIEKMGMNCYNKFILLWDDVFWDDDLFIVFTPEIPDKFNYFININKLDSNAKALMTAAYADYGRKSETLTDAEVTEEIMKHLRDMYGNNIPDPNEILRTKWQSNENSYGSFSYPTTTTKMSHYTDLAQDIGGRIFFAGEHTCANYFATTHGAYLSGVREAEKILWLLN